MQSTIPISDQYGREIRDKKFDGATHYYCECHGQPQWFHIGNCHEKTCPGKWWSKPVDVGAGFELVKYDPKSFPEKGWGYSCGSEWGVVFGLSDSTMKCCAERCGVIAFRRPIAKPAEKVDGWISVKLAAEDYALRQYNDSEPFGRIVAKCAFLAGAEWQKGQK